MNLETTFHGERIMTESFAYSMFCYALCMLLTSLSVAGAIQVGKTVTYKGGNMGSVVFDGRIHNEAGYHCMKCHNVCFMPNIGTAGITYIHHTAGKEYVFDA